jgi:polyisoprenoid-binding protein YceI
MRKRSLAPAGALLACLAGAAAASAAPVRLLMAPPSVQVGFRAYGIGMIPIDGHFTRFSGTLTLDDRDPTVCTMDLAAAAASLAMPSQAMTEDALGPDLLDVVRFPDFRYAGTCAGGQLDGTLLLHGVSRPLRLAVTVRDGVFEASGLMRRADWGMGARPLLAGPEVRITVRAGLPR